MAKPRKQRAGAESHRRGVKRRWDRNEVFGILLLVLAIGLLLSFMSYDPADPSLNVETPRRETANLIGKVGAYVADPLLQSLGLMAFSLPLILGYLGWGKLRGWLGRSMLPRCLGWLALCLSIAALLGLVFPDTWLWQNIRPGGFIGLLIAKGLSTILNTVGAALVLMTALVLTVVVAVNISVVEVTEEVVRLVSAFLARSKTSSQSTSDRRIEAKPMEIESAEEIPVDDLHTEIPLISPAAKKESAPASPERRVDQALIPPAGATLPLSETSAERRTISGLPTPGAQAGVETPPTDTTVAEESIRRDVEEMLSTAKVRMVRRDKKAAGVGQGSGPGARKRFMLPSIDFLIQPDHSHNPLDLGEEALMHRAKHLAQRCSEFAVTGHVHQISPGPVVTTFEFKPDPGVKYSRITSLVDDLCLAMEADAILIDRIPGKSTVGIEVPNKVPELIYLREIIESEKFQKARSRLAIALGKTIAGGIYISDLTKMPHLLIAGATGTGKSMTINAILISLLYRVTPEEVRFILIDPKRLELGLYDGLPHLLTPILMEPKRAANALKWAVGEMENRYRLLASLGVRNIGQFNKAVASGGKTIELESQGRTEITRLPYIVIVIDELADLMMVASSDVETSITRLAQMARAVGIHLILATQRPSVDVLTGLIKANFPSRIAFRVSSKVDSRTIIDSNGAEQLLGRGDMLFLPPGTSRLVRVHGAYVEEKEINAIINFLKSQAEPEYDENVTMSDKEREAKVAEHGELHYDELYEDAFKIVVQLGKASTSALQRRLRIGYGRAASIIDMMEREGFVEPPNGTRPRAITPAAREFYERLMQMEQE